MYVQPLFGMSEMDEMHQVMRDYPLATLVMREAGEIEANLLPLLLVEGGRHGRLAGHVSRAHDLARARGRLDRVTVVFQSPNAYISPRWYVNGQRSGRNAPSWNYVAVQAQGAIRFIEDAAWMREHLGVLTGAQEALRPEPWSPDRMDSEFLATVSERLLGFEIEISDLRGKKFLSQQRTSDDRASLARHLAQDAQAGAAAVSRLIPP